MRQAPAILLSAALAAGVLSAAELAVPAVREGGIDYSTQNEIDQVFRLAAGWLAARQGADGAWRAGGRPDIALTAQAALALEAVRLERARLPRGRALVWLGAHPSAATNAAARAREELWRARALGRVRAAENARPDPGWQESADPGQIWLAAWGANRGFLAAAPGWRAAAARRLVDGFRKDPGGGGFWPAPTEEGRVAATAETVFALRELGAE